MLTGSRGKSVLNSCRSFYPHSPSWYDLVAMAPLAKQLTNPTFIKSWVLETKSNFPIVPLGLRSLRSPTNFWARVIWRVYLFQVELWSRDLLLQYIFVTFKEDKRSSPARNYSHPPFFLSIPSTLSLTFRNVILRKDHSQKTLDNVQKF